MAYTTIDDPSVYFQIGLYTGNGNNNKNINLGSANFTGEYVGQDIQPDWVWIKNTDTNGKDHVLYDSSRGVTKQNYTNNNQAEDTVSNGVTSFNSNGFTLGNNGGPNAADDAHVAFVWKANAGSRTTFTESGNNPAGGYQANATAGFSIIDYTGTGATGTVAHGLGVTPKVAIIKDRDNAAHWVYATTTLDGSNDAMYLETTGAKFDSNSDIDITFTSSNVQLANNWTDVNGDGTKYIAYVFAPIKGYSRFGMYRGNGSADGTFVYTGFKPSFLMFKATSGSEGWGIFDNKRNTGHSVGNPRDIYLQPNNNNANSSESDSVDFLSNGFKWRIDSGFRNGDGVDFIYMAFAENPFTSSEGVPATAG